MSGSTAFSSTDHTTPAQVAAAVMAVLREMAGSSAVASQAKAHARPHNAFQTKSDETDPSVHQFPGTLVLERHANDLPFGTREIAVSPKTVVTPLAREILRKKGIPLRWVGANGLVGLTQRMAGEWSVLRLSDSSHAVSAESLLVGRTGDGWELAGPTLSHVSNWLLAAGGRHAAVLAEVGCVAVWRLNQAGVRAAEIRSAQDVERVVQHFAPQSLVVEPSKMPIHEVKQVFQIWRRMGLVPVPAQLDGAVTGEETSG